jgi:NAD(P)-dependent dehydrogenase (short-subunit alcohol dehydrogenase family)
MAQALATDKVALVTGAGGGIGRATAELFAREGARGVLVVDLKEDGGEETVERIRKDGGDAQFLRADVTDEAEVERMIRTAVETWGRLDCAHNNAGTSGTGGPFTDFTLAEFNRVIAINLTAVFLCMKHELRQMTAQDPQGGVIVNTSSGAGIIGFPSLPHYVASKHGVLGLTKTAAQEFARQNVRVNAICPGSTDTPMMRGFIGGNADIEAAMKATVPQGELGRPEWLAESVVWLCSDRAAWVNGESMLVDGGTVCR